MISDPMLAQQYGLPVDGPLAQPGEFDFSPLGMEFGEFMVDGDLLALVNHTDTLPPNAVTPSLP